jgi:hypothetical protein
MKTIVAAIIIIATAIANLSTPITVAGIVVTVSVTVLYN